MKKIYFVAFFGCLLSLGVIGYLFFKVVPSKKDLAREKIFGLQEIPNPSSKTPVGQTSEPEPPEPSPPEQKTGEILQVKKIKDKLKSLIDSGEREAENCEAEFDAFTGAIPSEEEDVDFFTHEANVQDIIERFSQLNFKAKEMGKVYEYLTQRELAKVGSEWLEGQLQELGPCRFEERAEFLSVLLNKKNMMKWGADTQRRVKTVVLDYFLQSLAHSRPLSQVDHLLVQLEMMEAEGLIELFQREALANIRKSFERDKGAIEERMFELEEGSQEDELGVDLFDLSRMEQDSSRRFREEITKLLESSKKEN